MLKVLICCSLSFGDCSVFWQINVMTSWKQENYNYRFHEILKIQPFCYTKNDISGHWQEIYFFKAWLTFQPDPTISFESVSVLTICAIGHLFLTI